MNKTSAVAVIIHAVSPELKVAASASSAKALIGTNIAAIIAPRITRKF